MQNNEPNIEIPSIFHCYDSKQPFERCIDCDKYLLEDDSEYFIEKAIKNYKGFKAQDVIFEYAICATCAEKMRKKISKESMEYIEAFFSNHVDINKRMEVMQNNPENPEAWMEHCLINGAMKSELEEFQLYAHCKGKHLELSTMPYMISGAALDEIAHILSDQTKDELDNFLNQHFGPPPELEELLPGKKRFVLV